jgi:hypothetical protein
MSKSTRSVLSEARGFALGLLLLASGCEWAAIQSAPPKTPDPAQTELSQKAKHTFWAALHAGDYQQAPEAIRLLTAAYLENPRQPEITLLLAHAHLWTIAERVRLPEIDPRITDHAILAERYFLEAHRLNREDHRILGWLGGIRLALGSIHADERLTREGYYLLHDAIRLYPEFNYFSAGYPLSSRPAGDEKFREGVEDMWQNLALCAGEPLDRANPDYRKYMAQETTAGPKRVCWNSWIAPHNFEGFFLNMGDMLVKLGEVEPAKKIYAIAKLSKDYPSWRYKDLLDARIAQAEERAKLFQQPEPAQHPEIMFRSAYACTACHAK